MLRRTRSMYIAGTIPAAPSTANTASSPQAMCRRTNASRSEKDAASLLMAQSAESIMEQTRRVMTWAMPTSVKEASLQPVWEGAGAAYPCKSRDCQALEESL